MKPFGSLTGPIPLLVRMALEHSDTIPGPRFFTLTLNNQTAKTLRDYETNSIVICGVFGVHNCTWPKIRAVGAHPANGLEQLEQVRLQRQ